MKRLAVSLSLILMALVSASATAWAQAKPLTINELLKIRRVGDPQLSPDGRWVAYASDESGRAEVYVQTFPASGGKWQISTGGGDAPQWRRDGRELFYLSPDKTLMAVAIAAGDTLEPGSPVALFPTRVPTGSLTSDRNHLVVAADGQRFLVNNLIDEGNPSPITFVLNWAANLKR